MFRLQHNFTRPCMRCVVKHLISRICLDRFYDPVLWPMCYAWFDDGYSGGVHSTAGYFFGACTDVIHFAKLREVSVWRSLEEGGGRERKERFAGLLDLFFGVLRGAIMPRT